MSMYEYKAHVDRVIDGDTFDCAIDLGFKIWTHQRIRMLGIDAPETRTKNLAQKELGLRSKEWLTDRIHLEEVILKTDTKTGGFGRVLATVWHNDENLNELMLEEGLADIYMR